MQPSLMCLVDSEICHICECCGNDGAGETSESSEKCDTRQCGVQSAEPLFVINKET